MNLKKIMVDEVNNRVNELYGDFSDLIKKHNLILVNPDSGTYFKMDVKNTSSLKNDSIKKDIEMFFKDSEIEISNVTISENEDSESSFVFAIQDNSLKNEFDEKSLNSAINGAIIKTLYGKSIIEKYDLLNSDNEFETFQTLAKDKNAMKIIKGETHLPEEIRRGFVMGLNTLTAIQKSLILNNPNETKIQSDSIKDKNSLEGVLKILQEEHKEDLAKATIEEISSSSKKNKNR